jgi:hypothetical protein
MARKPPDKTKVVPAAAVADEVVEIDFSRLFERIAAGGTLAVEAEKLKLPIYKLTGCIMRDAELSRQYQVAEVMRAMVWADEIVSIADESCVVDVTDRSGHVIAKGVDNAKVNDKRLRIDTRKWMVQKLLPRFKDDAADLVADALTELLNRVNQSGRALQITSRDSETPEPKRVAATITPRQ